MVTDGVLDASSKGKEQVFADYLATLTANNPQEIAELLLEYVREQNEYEDADDMTIMVAGMWKK